MKRIALATGLALAAIGAQAEPIQLASLANVDGKIMVNQGKGFVAAKPGMALTQGDRIIALDGSRAAVVYPDGCVTQLTENSLLALDKAGCGQQPVKTGATQPLRYAQAIGGPPRPVQPPPPSPPPPPGPLGGLGGFAAGGGLALGLGGVMLGTMLADSAQDEAPLSPR